ncbi:hypothetical protein D3C83_203030 [compost metagenome]
MAPVAELGSLIETKVPKRVLLAEEEARPPANIRQRVAAANDQPEEAPAVEKKGFLARMFGRR